MDRIRGNTNRPVIVLGAGLTGMSAALWLQRHGVEHWLVERQPFVGGLASTTSEAGYRFDRTGHLLHLREPERHNDLLALLDTPPIEISRRSCVYSERVYTRYPYQSNVQGLPPAIAYACVVDFIRAQTHATSVPPRNFEEYCRWHFGNTITERFMLPYNRRLWGIEPSEISTSWCDRFVPIPTIEDVVAGALGYEPPALGYNSNGLYPRTGMGELCDAMGRQAHSLVLRTEPRRILARVRRVDFDGWSSTYQQLISALPLPQLLRLIDDVPQSVVSASRHLRCSQLYYLDVALNRPPRVAAHWVYVPEERFPFYRVGNYAAFSPDMAPEGTAGLYVELADHTAPDLSRIWPTIEAGLREMGFISGPDDVSFCRVRKIDYAYVIYDSHREQALSIIQDFLESIDIISTGRYGGWNYSSMEDALDFGRDAAQLATMELK